MNLQNLQKDLIDSAQINDVSKENDLTKKFEIKYNKNKQDAFLKEIICGYMSNEKPKNGFRKKQINKDEISNDQVVEYGNRKYNDDITIKDKIVHDILGTITSKVMNDYEGRRVSNPVHKFLSEDNHHVIYEIMFNIIEGPENIEFENILVDKIIYGDDQISEEEVQNAQAEILKRTYDNEICDENFIVQEGSNVEIVFDFDGKLLAGKKKIKFKGGSAKDYRMKVGAGKMLPEFEQNLIGMKIGETKTFLLTFPKDYHAGLSNETAEFEVTLKKVIEKKAYETLEAYLEKNNKTEEEFIKDIKAFLKEEVSTKIQMIEKDQLFEKLDEYFHDMKLPSNLVEKEFEMAKESYESRKKQKDAHVHDEHCNHENDDEDFQELSDEELMAIVKTKTKLMILIMNLAEKYNITPGQNDMINEIVFQAKNSGMDVFEAFQYFQSNKQANEYLQKTVLEKKIIEFCLSKANRNEKNLNKADIDELYKKILQD